MKRTARHQRSNSRSSPGLDGIDSTTLLRRHGIWILPLLVLALAVVLQALVPGSGKIMLAASAASMIGGLALRKVRRASAVVLVWSVVTAFASLVLLGILFPLVGLALTGHTEWIAPTALSAATALCIITGVRTRVAFAQEFNQALESVPGVHVGSEGVFRYQLLPREHPLLGPVAWTVLGILTITLLMSYGTEHYLMFVLGVCPVIAALFCVDPVARVFALLIALLRWERGHGKRLYLPSLEV